MTRRDVTWAVRDLAMPGWDLPLPGSIRWRHRLPTAPNPVEDKVAEAVAPVLDWFDLVWWHTPNEGTRAKRVSKAGKRWSPEANRLRRQGVKAGVPDIVIATPPPAAVGRSVRGVAIELKREEGSVLEQEQADMLAHLRSCGWLVFVCCGYQDVLDALRFCGWAVS